MAQKGAQPTKRDAMVLGDSGIVARVSQSATASLRMRGIVPPAGASMILFPSDTRIATLQPVLRLRDGAAHAGATATVLDEDGKSLWSGSIGRGSVRLPLKLAARSRYSWKVAMPGAAAEEARFETLSPEDLARLQRSQGKARTFTDRVQQAMLLQDLGARQEAREAWAVLAHERPDLPELASLAR
jgi:hypothetical protein